MALEFTTQFFKDFPPRFEKWELYRFMKELYLTIKEDRVMFLRNLKDKLQSDV